LVIGGQRGLHGNVIQADARCGDDFLVSQSAALRVSRLYLRRIGILAGLLTLSADLFGRLNPTKPLGFYVAIQQSGVSYMNSPI
jgi:hypothetical protein